MTDPMPAEAAHALRNGGWQPGSAGNRTALSWAHDVAAMLSPDGLRHTVVPAAELVMLEFGGVCAVPPGPGREVAASGFTVDPRLAAHSWIALAEFAETLGAAVFPLGEEHGTAAILVVDEHGRVFALDHTGEWFLGDSPAEAWSTLLLGHRPPRVRTDGTWADPRPGRRGER